MATARIIHARASLPPWNGHLLPIVSYLSIFGSEASILLASTTMGPKMKTLFVQLRNQLTINESLETFLTDVPMHCPNLVTLRLQLVNNRNGHFGYGNALATHVSNCTLLEEFATEDGEMTVTEELLVGLSRLPKLKKLMWSTYFMDLYGQSMRPLLEAGCFPSLEVLHVGGLNKSAMEMLGSPHFQPERLTETTMSMSGTKDLVQPFLSAITPAGTTSKIEIIDLLLFDFTVTIESMTRVQAMHCLKKLEVAALDISLSDVDMAQLLSSLPALEMIRLNSNARRTAEPGRLTLLVLHYLMQYCPLLKEAKHFLTLVKSPLLPSSYGGEASARKEVETQLRGFDYQICPVSSRLGARRLGKEI